jgi:hypothetical protein
LLKRRDIKDSHSQILERKGKRKKEKEKSEWQYDKKKRSSKTVVKHSKA